MATNEVLRFTQQEGEDFFPNIVNVYQDGDGAFYYLKVGRPQKVYSKAEDGSEPAQVPVYAPAEINYVVRINSGIYFQTEENKIYYAKFTAPSAMKTKFLRQIGEDESREINVMCSRVRDGQKVVYRLCDDPETDGVVVDASESQLEGLRMKAVHRGKIIFERIAKQEAATIERLTDNIIVVGSVFPGYDFGFVDDSTPLIHHMITPTLEVYNTETMIVESLATDLPKAFFRVVGVDKRRITVQAGRILFTAQLPERTVA